MRLVNAKGSPCTAGEVGTVQVQGPNVFAGYWKLPEKTDEAYDAEWFVTGDVGFIDEEGRLTLEGRTSDMIISGGLNVYPREVELVIDAFDGVVESAVVGKPDADLGERVEAYVVADSVDLDGLHEHLRGQLAAFKIPKRVELIDALPRNTMGKVQKVALRNENGPNDPSN